MNVMAGARIYAIFLYPIKSIFCISNKLFEIILLEFHT